MLKAAEERVLVRLDKPKEVSDGGVVLPAQAVETSVWGTVESVGGKVREDSIVRGVRVLLASQYAGAEIKDRLIAVMEEEILATEA